MGLTRVHYIMAGENNKTRARTGRSRSKKPKRHGGPAKKIVLERNAELNQAAKLAARQRFDTEPKPIGIPEDIPRPKEFSFVWENNPVPLKTEAHIASRVIRKGSLDGFLMRELTTLVKL